MLRNPAVSPASLPDGGFVREMHCGSDGSHLGPGCCLPLGNRMTTTNNGCKFERVEGGREREARAPMDTVDGNEGICVICAGSLGNRIMLNAQYTRFTNRLTLRLASVTIQSHLRFRGAFVRCPRFPGVSQHDFERFCFPVRHCTVYRDLQFAGSKQSRARYGFFAFACRSSESDPRAHVACRGAIVHHRVTYVVPRRLQELDRNSLSSLRGPHLFLRNAGSILLSWRTNLYMQARERRAHSVWRLCRN